MPPLQQQIHNVRMAMMQKLPMEETAANEPGEQIIYSPEKLEAFCKANGGPTVFSSLHDMMAPLKQQRQTNRRDISSRKYTVIILYLMMYGQSQMSNWLQRDVSKFLHYHGLSDTGMRAMHEMGLALGTTTFYRTMQQDSSPHLAKIDKIIRQAMRDKKLIVVIIDDYSNIHTRRRPQDNPANISHMATVILRVFDLPAIAVQQPPANFPGAINIHLLLNNFLHNMPLFFRTFIAGGPQQLNQYFFNPHNERLRLTTHMYGESNNVRQVRAVANAHLIDCTQQTLKSLTDYRNAANVYLHTALQEYLQQYQLLIPGDWPSQFHQRQLYNNEPQDSLLRNTTAMMGPLHVSLNAQENVVLKFINFFSAIYRHLFNRQLAKKPKPWRITLLLELLFGGWTLIREPVLQRLQRFKDVQFLTLINLVDNYVPLALCIYSVIFKANAFHLYSLAMQQVWIMYYTFNRRHYDKAPLVWLANTSYWQHTQHPIFTLLQNSLYTTDESPVENFHSLLRARTNEWDTAATIQTKARWIDENRHALLKFSSWFGPPRHETLSVKQLR